MSKDFYTASELAALGYVSERLTSVFDEPDSAGGELRWDTDTVDAVERDVLAPAARSCSMPSLRNRTHASR